MRLKGETKLTQNIYEEIKKIFTQNNEMSNDFITIKEILNILKIHPEWLWYYAIPNENGLFILQGKNRLSVPYLNLGIEHPCYNQQNILFEFHFDLNGGMSLQTNNDYLRTKVYELIIKLYTERFYNRHCIRERKILEPIPFRKEFFSEEIKRELIKLRNI